MLTEDTLNILEKMGWLSKETVIQINNHSSSERIKKGLGILHERAVLSYENVRLIVNTAINCTVNPELMILGFNRYPIQNLESLLNYANGQHAFDILVAVYGAKSPSFMYDALISAKSIGLFEKKYGSQCLDLICNSNIPVQIKSALASGIELFDKPDGEQYLDCLKDYEKINLHKQPRNFISALFMIDKNIPNPTERKKYLNGLVKLKHKTSPYAAIETILTLRRIVSKQSRYQVKVEIPNTVLDLLFEYEYMNLVRYIFIKLANAEIITNIDDFDLILLVLQRLLRHQNNEVKLLEINDAIKIFTESELAFKAQKYRTLLEYNAEVLDEAWAQIKLNKESLFNIKKCEDCFNKILVYLNEFGELDFSVKALIDLQKDQKSTLMSELNPAIISEKNNVSCDSELLRTDRTPPKNKIIMALARKYLQNPPHFFPFYQEYEKNPEHDPVISQQENKIEIGHTKLMDLNRSSKELFTSSANELRYEYANNLELRFYKATNRGCLQSNDRCIFIIAGRVEHALLPTLTQKEKVRCVVVLTESEYLRLNLEQNDNSLTQYYDFLVLVNLSVGNSSKDALGAVTNRRRATLYFAEQSGLAKILMIDDNIECFYIDALDASVSLLDALYVKISSLQDRCGEPIVSLATACPRNSNAFYFNTNYYLGSKVFMLDLKAIKDKLPPNSMWIALFPEYEKAWGEDYFMQIMAYFIFDQSQGYRVLDPRITQIKRSYTNQNYAKNQGIIAQALEV